jgi:hypothetical protein
VRSRECDESEVCGIDRALEAQILRLTTPKLKSPGAQFVQDDSASIMMRAFDSEHLLMFIYKRFCGAAWNETRTMNDLSLKW